MTSDHLNAEELDRLIIEGPEALSQDKMAHLNSCRYCNQLFNEQRRFDSLLHKLHPYEAGDHILKCVREKLSLKTRFYLKMDWLAYAAMLVLVAIFFYMVIGQNPFMGNAVSKGVAQVSRALGAESLNFRHEQWTGTFQSVKPFLPSLNIDFSWNLPDNSPALFIYSLFVLVFYYLLDKLILARRFEARRH